MYHKTTIPKDKIFLIVTDNSAINLRNNLLDSLVVKIMGLSAQAGLFLLCRAVPFLMTTLVGFYQGHSLIGCLRYRSLDHRTLLIVCELMGPFFLIDFDKR